jgi:hypothetical protein
MLYRLVTYPSNLLHICSLKLHLALDNVDVGAQESLQNRALSLAKAPYNIAVKRHNDL